MTHFKFYNKKDVLSLTQVRRFETKLGESINCIQQDGEYPQVLSNNPCKYVLFGIPEDLGVKANYGMGGADTAWTPFLQAFLNLQSNDFLPGNDIMVLGHFDFGDIQFLIESHGSNPEEKVNAYRHAVSQIDDAVEDLVKAIVQAGKIPIAIGGGHNNAYPMIKASAKGLNKLERIPIPQINCINLDAHTDYRPAEGRHSGNGFRYAEEDGFLGKYAIVGLQESYVQQNVLKDMEKNAFVQFHTYEEIFLRERKNFIQAVAQSTAFTSDSFTGIELDLDCIENVLSSAQNPAGISLLHARQYVNFVATDSRVAYLHICEGAQQLSNGNISTTVGKLIAVLVSDFIKAHSDAGES